MSMYNNTTATFLDILSIWNKMPNDKFKKRQLCLTFQPQLVYNFLI